MREDRRRVLGCHGATDRGKQGPGFMRRKEEGGAGSFLRARKRGTSEGVIGVKGGEAVPHSNLRGIRQAEIETVRGVKHEGRDEGDGAS